MAKREEGEESPLVSIAFGGGVFGCGTVVLEQNWQVARHVEW